MPPNFEQTIAVPKEPENRLAFVTDLLTDKWFLSQMIALLVSFLSLVALFFGLDSMSAPMSTSVLQAGRVEQSLSSHLRGQLNSHPEMDVVVQRHSQVPLLDVPNRKINWSWQGPHVFTNGPSSVYQLTLADENGWSVTVPVNVSVRVRAPVFISKHVIQPRALIKGDDFIVQEMEVVPSILQDLVVRSIPEKQRARSLIPQGAILSKSQLEDLPSIQTGSVIDLILRDGGLALRVGARARQDGRIGDKILVQSIDTQKTFQAIVKDDHSVEVTPR